MIRCSVNIFREGNILNVMVFSTAISSQTFVIYCATVCAENILISGSVNPRLSDPRLSILLIIQNRIWKIFKQIKSDY